MISLIQYFEADFLCKVSLKIQNSGIILKTFNHLYYQTRWTRQIVLGDFSPNQNPMVKDKMKENYSNMQVADMFLFFFYQVSF